jgi:hypothetical protein
MCAACYISTFIECRVTGYNTIVGYDEQKAVVKNYKVPHRTGSFCRSKTSKVTFLEPPGFVLAKK